MPRASSMIVVEPEHGDFGGQKRGTIYHIGVRQPDGEWAAEFERRCTLTPNEAWALAGLLSVATGLPVQGVDITADGETIQ